MAKRRKRGKRTRQSSAALLRNGLKAFRSGDYDGAVETWERVGQQTLRMRPTSALAQVYFRRGLKRIYGQPPDPTGGIDDLSRAVGLLPDDPGYTYHLGLAAHRLGELGRAIPAYRAARKGGGEFANRAAYPLALALVQQGQEPADDPVWSALTAEEQTMLRQVHAFRRRPYTLSPDAPPLWRGLAALDAGDHDQAQALLDEALQRAAGPVEEGMAHYYLGVLAARGEDWDAARQHWNGARASGLALPRLEDTMGEVYHRLAEERLESGDAEDALAAGMEALRHKPDDRRLGELISQAHQRLAYEAASAGQWTSATQHWEAADEAEGGSFRLAYNLALACERAKDFIAAGERWREALRRRPRRDDHPDAIDDGQVSQLWRRAAEAYSKAGEYDEAVRVYRQAVKWNPDHVDTRMALAEMLLANGQSQAAENELGRILERDPDNIPALLRQGEAIAASGSWWRDSPVSCWERVLELEPDNPTARQLLADFYQDQADYHLSWAGYESAVEMYRQALAYQPENGRILAALGGCHLRMNEEAVAQDYIEQALAAAPEDLSVYDQVIHAWLDVEQPDQAWEVMAKAEAAVETIPYEFYINQAYYCIQQSGDLARPWLTRAVEKAPSDEPVLIVIGEMAVATRAWGIAREYLEQALAAGQVVGEAHLMLGIVDAQEGDLEAAKKHWAEAEQIARRERDQDLLERARMARVLFSGPPGLASFLMSLGGGPFDPSFPDFYDEDDDEFSFFGEDEDDDDFWD
jgi:tetratricopeptide (TPR) repeat protein